MSNLSQADKQFLLSKQKQYLAQLRDFIDERSEIATALARA